MWVLNIIYMSSAVFSFNMLKNRSFAGEERSGGGVVLTGRRDDTVWMVTCGTGSPGSPSWKDDSHQGIDGVPKLSAVTIVTTPRIKL